MQLQLLKGSMVSKGLTYQDCSKFLGISHRSFSNKMTGKTQFTVQEVEKLSNLLKLKDSEIMNIFFRKNVA